MRTLLLKPVFRFSSPGRSLLEQYQADVKATGKVFDPIQVDVIKSLQRLNDQLNSTHSYWLSRRPSYTLSQSKPVQSSDQTPRSFFAFAYPNFTERPKPVQSEPTYTLDPGSQVKGLYLYGGSGCGKTYLSEIFFNNLTIKEKMKTHFHEFMATVQRDLFRLEKEKKSYDPLTTIANERARTLRLLFLDEFQVTDVADASILKRLFEKLIGNGLVLLATSNRAPEDLYKNGHQREHFIPFITFLNQKCQIKEVDTEKDYRYDLQTETDVNKKHYLSPINESTDKRLDRIFGILSKTKSLDFTPIYVEPIPGRKLKVPRSVNGVCMYFFQQLCDNVMSDTDFRAICRSHKYLIVKHIPKIETSSRNIANRFIKLLDQVYVNNVQFICNAEVPLSEIISTLQPEDAVTQEDFAINRCKSRLVEFQAKKYRQKKSYYQEHHTP